MEWVDAVGTVLICASLAMMGWGYGRTMTAYGMDPFPVLYIDLMATGYVLMARANCAARHRGADGVDSGHRVPEGPQEQHLFDCKFAVVPVATDHAKARFNVLWHQKLGMDNQVTQTGGVGFEDGQRVFQHLGPGGLRVEWGMWGELDDRGQGVVSFGGHADVVGGRQDDLHHRSSRDLAILDRVEGGFDRVDRGCNDQTVGQVGVEGWCALERQMQLCRPAA